eukprot:6214815-Pleurochrysis_carterae.AAC.1
MLRRIRAEIGGREGRDLDGDLRASALLASSQTRTTDDKRLISIGGGSSGLPRCVARRTIVGFESLHMSFDAVAADAAEAAEARAAKLAKRRRRPIASAVELPNTSAPSP